MIDEYYNIKNNLADLAEKRYEIRSDGNTYLKREFNVAYNSTEKSNILNLISYASEWLYSPVDEELENMLYFMDFEKMTNEDLSILNKIKKKISFHENNRDNIRSIEDYYNGKIYDLLKNDLDNKNYNDNNNIEKDYNDNNRSFINRKYGLKLNNKI